MFAMTPPLFSMVVVISVLAWLQAAILGVPFVDVVTTERDTAQLLTVAEWDEWGDPLHNASAYEYMLSYSPYDNIGRCGHGVAQSVAQGRGEQG